MGSLHLKEKRSYPHCSKESDKEDDPQVWGRDPMDVEHAHEIDARNGNTLWRDALKKEMYNVGVAFEILDEGVHVPHGWKQVTRHLVCDVKMDFTRKARWVLDGHKTPDPIGSTYAGVVSRESVHI